MVFQVPAKYLGSEVNQLLGKIDDETVTNLTIPVTATIGGSFNAPELSTDLSSAISSLTQQLIEIQKQKLLNRGTNEIKDIVKDVFNQNDNSETSTPPITQTDSTRTSSVEESIKDMFGNVFNRNKKKDSVSE